jgi:hypothetical protein
MVALKDMPNQGEPVDDLFDYTAPIFFDRYPDHIPHSGRDDRERVIPNAESDAREPRLRPSNSTNVQGDNSDNPTLY